jgi:hypothetical protein
MQQGILQSTPAIGKLLAWSCRVLLTLLRAKDGEIADARKPEEVLTRGATEARPAASSSMLNSITPTKVGCRSIVLFVGFSDHRRLDVVWFGVAIFVFVLGIIIVVGVSRRHRVAHDGSEAPAGNVLGNARDHVGLRLDVATFMDGR